MQAFRAEALISLAGGGLPAYGAAMQIPLVMSVIGKDRPGLVESVASLVTEHGGNWLESRMCRLGGEFAGILRVSIAKDRQAALETALHGLADQGLAVNVRMDSGEDEMPGERILSFEIFGPDRPGIVRQMTAALAAEGVNVEEFSSECGCAPMSGEILFTAHVIVQIPDSCDVEVLCKNIEELANNLGMDVDFEDEDDDEE
jgi:glycine cleavage system regulatory protein